MSFVHLSLHTEYSLVDSLIRIDQLMNIAAEQQMSAIAITDQCNLFAAVKWYQAAKRKGIKPVFGCDFLCVDPVKPAQTFRLLLLCQNNVGYRNLTCLISKAYQDGQLDGQPLIKLDWVKSFAEGLIAISGGREGNIGRSLLADDFEQAHAQALEWSRIFPQRFYLEVQRTGRIDEALYNERVVSLADKLHLPLVATNDVRFLNADDYDAHEARVCIREGYALSDPRRKSPYSRQQYLRSAAEMALLFHDLPQALQNSVEISKRCTVKLELGKNYLPNFPVPDGSSIENYLSHLSQEGLKQRFHNLTVEQKTIYEDRLQLELSVINSMGFAGYFLIVADFIQWAKRNDIPVGPGRGSGAGSLVAYALMITDLDPLQYELLFERFLNPERISMPDFDIDFCMDGRDRVIEYVAEKYGRQSVSQIITFGTMAAKAVIRDVGRVLGHPYGFVDALAKMIPFEIGITLKDTLKQEETFRQRYEDEEDVKELVDLALKLEGITRNVGKHAGGVVIAPSQLTDFTAIYCENGSTQIVSQFDKDDVEAVGLVKFDFLGLRTLTIIHRALKIINQNGVMIDINAIPLDDPLTFKLLGLCQTTAVFQLESRGMKELIHRLQPDRFEEIIALVALFRPGPLQSGMVDDFIDRKRGRATVVYPHPDCEPILKPTYGVILYQEQVMQIAQVLANYTLGGADLLRRAMGKKKPEEMAEQREIFVTGATQRGILAETATIIFDLMEKFAGYGFNKSHSAAYALIAYQTAWLKAHYPAAFMAAVMSSDLDHTDKVVGFINECVQMQLNVLPPSLNSSEYMFSVLDDKTILYGLGAIKGVGEGAVECLIQARTDGGPFLDLFDLCKRIDSRKVTRRVLEVLIKSGSMDEFGIERAQLFASIDNAIQLGEQFHKNQRVGQRDFFDLLDEEELVQKYDECEPWSFMSRLDYEKETLGMYLTGHPSDPYLTEWSSFITPIKDLTLFKSKRAKTCGLITELRRITTKNNKKLVIIKLENATISLDIVVFSEVMNAHESWITNGQVIVIEGELSQDQYTRGVKMSANNLLSIDSARERFGKYLLITLSPENSNSIAQLRALLSEHPGECDVQLEYSNASVVKKMQLGEAWRVKPSMDLLSKLVELLPGSAVKMYY